MCVLLKLSARDGCTVSCGRKLNPSYACVVKPHSTLKLKNASKFCPLRPRVQHCRSCLSPHPSRSHKLSIHWQRKAYFVMSHKQNCSQLTRHPAFHLRRAPQRPGTHCSTVRAAYRQTLDRTLLSETKRLCTLLVGKRRKQSGWCPCVNKCNGLCRLYRVGCLLCSWVVWPNIRRFND